MTGQWYISKKKTNRETPLIVYIRQGGFISINGEREAVVQCSLKPLSWDKVEKNFIQEIQLGTKFDVSFVTVPIESIVHPLCVFPDIGGSLQKHFVVLPSRNWSRFFGNQIICS